MKNEPVLRRTTCAVMVVAFLAVAVTGVLRLLHFRNGIIITVHEWIGLVFAVAALGHLVLNGKALGSYLKRREVRWAALAVATVLAGLVMVGATRQPPFHRHGQRGYGQRGYGQRGYGQRGYGRRGDGQRGARQRGARHRGDCRRGPGRWIADN